MKPGQLIVPIILVIFLMAWGVIAHEPYAGNIPSAAKQMSMIREQLALTDEQAVAVQDILAVGKEAMEGIIASHGLQRRDMRKMQGELKKFREQGLEKLAAILDQKQLRILDEEIFASGPLGFMQLSEKEKRNCLQDILEVSEEKVNQVATVLDDGRVQREKALENLGLNHPMMMAFHQDVAVYQKEMKKSLSELLSEKQMERFEEFSDQMNQRNRNMTIQSWSKGNRYDA